MELGHRNAEIPRVNVAGHKRRTFYPADDPRHLGWFYLVSLEMEPLLQVNQAPNWTILTLFGLCLVNVITLANTHVRAIQVHGSRPCLIANNAKKAMW